MVSVVIIDEVGSQKIAAIDINCDINTAIGILQDTDGMILLIRTE
jgi:hypothetical protein